MSPADPPSTSVDTLAAAKASTSGHLASDSPPPSQPHPPATAGSTPWGWRLAILSGIVLLAGIAYGLRETIGLRGQAAVGVVFFFGLVAACSTNLRAVNWKTILGGIGLQLLLALLVLKCRVTLGGREYSVYGLFEWAGEIVKVFTGFAGEGAKFVFGNLAQPADVAGVFGDKFLFPFAFNALPPILFVSAFFTVLYHFGILQKCVQLLAKVMVHLMGTSGAETLSVSANVFMGQTEAPLIVKPYVPRMTNSELFALMTSGMAHISGGMMAVYINYGANPVAVLTTCVMACPCSLYLAKLFMPEQAVPETLGSTPPQDQKSPYVNAVDAATSGTSDGLRLALNVCAMLIVFIAFIAMFDGLLSLIDTRWLSDWMGGAWPEKLSLSWIFGQLFSPVAFLMGVESADQAKVGTLLGTKLALNEHVAYLTMKDYQQTAGYMSERSYQLAAFALTGFANFASVGIQLGGIGAMAPERRSDLARLGMRALFVGFVATLLNAAVAGVFLASVL
jgi:CNT family concentrative nucleoside transporter